MSERKQTLIVLGKQTKGFVSRSSILWNEFRTKIGIEDFSYTIGKLKTDLKKRLMRSQKIGSKDDWNELNHKF